jgi:hypothetical protein
MPLPVVWLRLRLLAHSLIRSPRRFQSQEQSGALVYAFMFGTAATIKRWKTAQDKAKPVPSHSRTSLLNPMTSPSTQSRAEQGNSRPSSPLIRVTRAQSVRAQEKQRPTSNPSEDPKTTRP